MQRLVIHELYTNTAITTSPGTMLAMVFITVDQAEKEYREAMIQGWPLGLLRMAHYMSLDVGGMRYMRAFRWSGYSVYIMLW